MKSFVDKIEMDGNTIKEVYKDVLNEMIFDTKVIMEETDSSELTYLVAEMISKYCLVINLLEMDEEYEKCSEILKMLKVVVLEYYPITKEELEYDINLSITLYKELLNGN